MGTTLTIIALVGLFFGLGGRKKKSNGGNGGGGGGGGGSTRTLPAFESVFAAECHLFTSTHAAATPTQLAGDALASFGVYRGEPDAVGLIAQADAAAEQLYSGGIVCDTSDGQDPYAPGPKTCHLNGEPYNAAIWTSVEAVDAEIRALGYDGVATASGRKKAIQGLQAIFRSRPGFILTGQAAKEVDGIPGACFLLDLSRAREQRKAGTWPYSLTPRGGPLLTAMAAPLPGQPGSPGHLTPLATLMKGRRAGR